MSQLNLFNDQSTGDDSNRRLLAIEGFDDPKGRQLFQHRVPAYAIMIILSEQVYIGKNKEIYQRKIERQKIALPTVVDEYEKYWLTFYKTQFIPERKNLRYLKQMIPKKYWGWVTELNEFGIK